MTNDYKYFVANWKMFGDIKTLNSINKNTKIDIGAQNCHHSETTGPFTGFINPKMIKNLGCKYVIIGHSENRSIGESNYLINKCSIFAYYLFVSFYINQFRDK